MGREIDSLLDLLNFYKTLGFRELPKSFFINVLTRAYPPDETNGSPKFNMSVNTAIEKLNQEIKQCTKCILSNVRKNPVCGEGSLIAKLMFIGEAPGVDEDLQGRPFVGEAGKLLTKLIEKIGFKREDVYITNAVKCHPPGNRDPIENEISTCFDYLKREIDIVYPQVIITLGKVATYVLKGMKGKLKDLHISRERGKVFFYSQIPVVPTFHPAYLLRNRRDKWLTWEDAQQALRMLK